MANKTYNHLAGQKISRLEAISDGVFAIAMTLLVLDIHVPIGQSVKTESDLLSVLIEFAPKLLSYLLSFMTLGIFWVGQATQFKFINRTDRNLTWLSIFFLMFVSIVPFTTAFLSEYINFKTAIGVYWLNLFFLGWTLYLHWRYAAKKNFIDSKFDFQPIDKAIKSRILYAQLFYAIGASLCFINNYLSVIFIVLIQLNYALALFFTSRGKAATIETEE